MADFAILEITDGTTTVDLLKGAQAGFHLDSWRPKIIGAKGGGDFLDSPLGGGRQLTNRVFGVANEVFRLKITGHGQNGLIREAQDLMRLLEKMVQYWQTDWQDTPVYLKSKATCETNARFALIHFYDIPELDNPYASPFFNATHLVTMDAINLGIERGHWLASAPGNSECVQASNTYDWSYDSKWETLQSGFNSQPHSIVKSPTTGSLFMVDEGVGGPPTIYKSSDEGDTWVSVHTFAAGTGRAGLVTVLPNGNVIGIDQQDSRRVVKSTDDGGSFSNVGTISQVDDDSIGRLVALLDGTLLIGASSAANNLPAIYKSTDEGANWSLLVEGLGSRQYVSDILEAANGDLFASVAPSGSSPSLGHIWRSQDDGASWFKVFSVNTGAAGVNVVTQLASGRYLATYSSNNNLYIIISDNGADWERVANLNDLGIELDDSLFVIEFGELVYLGAIADGTTLVTIYTSNDEGVTWSIEDQLAVTAINPVLRYRGAVETSLGIVSVAESVIIGRSGNSTQTLGQSATCDNKVFVANKHNISNLTNIKIEDNSLGTFTELFPISAFPADLLPDPAGNNDALYFGIDSSIINAGPFCCLVVDEGQELIAENSSISWEYYNGAWVSLSTYDDTLGFEGSGLASVHFRQPSDWTTTAIDGVTALWIRARLTVSSGSVTQIPQQQSSQIYTVALPYIEIAAAQVTGDIPAIARIKAQNQSDKDGGSNAPILLDNRLIVGLRSYDRGNNFQAYLNYADEQNPAGVSVSVGTGAAFADDTTTPTGRRITYTAASGHTSYADRATIGFGPSIARDFYGTFHIFLRAKQHTGSAGDIDLRIQIRGGSGGVTKTTNALQFETTNDWQLLDFGRMTLPAAGLLSSDELGDQSTIALQAKNTSGASRTVYFYDLILIPIDEWVCDSSDQANISDSVIGRRDDIPKLLDVDSLTRASLKRKIRSLVRTVGGEFVTSIYLPAANGPAILQANARQRLWFLAAQYGASDEWVSKPEVVHSVQVFANPRYLGMRGDR